MGGGEIRRAIVFPGQGSVGGEGSRARCAKRCGLPPEALRSRTSSRSSRARWTSLQAARSGGGARRGGRALAGRVRGRARGGKSRARGRREARSGEGPAHERGGQRTRGDGSPHRGGPSEVVRAAEEAEGAVVAATSTRRARPLSRAIRGRWRRSAERVRGRKVELDVAGAFHSPLMRGVAGDGRDAGEVGCRIRRYRWSGLRTGGAGRRPERRGSRSATRCSRPCAGWPLSRGSRAWEWRRSWRRGRTGR